MVLELTGMLTPARERSSAQVTLRQAASGKCVVRRTKCCGLKAESALPSDWEGDRVWRTLYGGDHRRTKILTDGGAHFFDCKHRNQSDSCKEWN